MNTTKVVIVVLSLFIILGLIFVIYKLLNDDEKATKTESSTSEPSTPEPSTPKPNAPENKPQIDILKCKNEFFEETFQLELKNIGKVPNAIKLFFSNPPTPQNINQQSPPEVIFKDDSLLEIYKLLEQYDMIAANTAANAYTIGGGYTTAKENRDGKGTQEEGAMGLIHGLLASLTVFAQKRARGDFRKNKQGRLLYEQGTLDKKILLSQSLKPRFKLDLAKKYEENSEGQSHFTDYVAYKLSLTKDILSVDNSKNMFIYSIAAYDRRGKKGVDYNKLFADTLNQITTMLTDAADRGCQAIVITIPGSGVFSNKTRGNDAEKDSEYVKNVEDATVKAVKEFGYPFKKIIICGHSKKPVIF